MISIIIPTLLRCEENLYRLLDTLIIDNSVDEIIVINNSLKSLNYQDEKLKIINPNENIYVNPAWNLGIKEAKNEIIGLLNDDIMICEDFCSKIKPLIKKENGIYGIDENFVKIVDKTFLPPKQKIQIKPINYRPSGFGVAMFFHKDSYYEIPSELKIMFGDDWLIQQNKKEKKQNLIISGQTVNHLGSISSSNTKLNPICKNDIKIYKKFMIKWYHRIFSIEENWDSIKLRLFGVTLKFKKPKQEK